MWRSDKPPSDPWLGGHVAGGSRASSPFAHLMADAPYNVTDARLGLVAAALRRFWWG
ncbi:hypothetical protein [Streptomyces mirabilis]|uniref:hypothetical protein n=1 Tax=Streptomyces mirabilis TaxID=68239 RepID=UPI00331EA3D2